MGSTLAFFSSYTLSVTFVSNCIQWLDLPHLVISILKKFLAKVGNKPYVDTFVFDIGYYQAFIATIGLMCLMLSVVMPIIGIFATLFFYLRFNIEKYNFLFVYNQDFDSHGEGIRSVISYQIFVIIAY